MESSNEMENLLAGYSDTLQFILQFLHTEGFQEAENVLMQEIEKRLPVLLEEKIAAGGLGSSSVSNATEPEVGEEEWAAEPSAAGLEQRSNVQTFSEGQSRDPEEDCNAGPFAELDSSLSQVDIGAVDTQPQPPTVSNPELRKALSMPGDSPAAGRETKRSLSLPIMGRNSCADEYSDDEDTGYVRIEIEDQEAFLATELETQQELMRGSDASSEEGGDGAAGASQSHDNGLQSGASSRSSSGSSSCKSSYFSGELSEEIPGSVSRISDCGSPNREGFLNSAGVDMSDLNFSNSASLPPADADVEVDVMGLDPAGTAPAIMADRIEAPEADADAAHSTSENTLVESVPESQTSLVDLAAPSITVSTEQAPDEVSSPVGVEDVAERTCGVEPASPPTHKGEGAAVGGVDFAFPVTPTAEDPAVVFSTWTHLRSRSLSNASDLSGFSPSQQSPERGTLLDSVSGTSPAKSAPSFAVSNAGGELGKVAGIEHGNETSLGQQQDVSFPPLPPAGNSSQTAWRQGPEESEKQALFVLEALEHAQNSSGQVPKERFGSYGSHMSAGSPEAPSPLNSATEMVALWNDEEAQDKESDGSSEPEAEFSIPYSSDEFVPAADFDEKDDDEDVARDTPTAEFTSQEGQPEKDVAEKAEDLEVMQYDPEQLAKEYEIFNLQIVHRRNHTGFEETKDFPIRLNDCVAGRYQILDFLGSAAFSRAVQALDLKTGMLVCLKIIKNNKDYFDQSLDEIKLLKYVNSADPMDTAGILQMYDYFYYKEHLFIVCELLRANLYEFQKYNRDSGDEPYFILPRLQTIAQQVLKSLAFLHGLGLIHSDLKPENILIKSYSRCEVKVIDLGSSCFTTDHLSNYVQSRSYRAPEVILGQSYDQRIDIWSLGCILAELASGYVLFQNDSLATLIARLIGILGPFPKDMLKSGRYVHRFLTRSGHPYERSQVSGNYQLLRPKQTSLAARVPQGDPEFIDFLRHLLTLDPTARPTAAEALEHPWLRKSYPPVTEAGS